MKKYYKKFNSNSVFSASFKVALVAVFAVFLLTLPLTRIEAAESIVSCGRSDQSMCTLCDIIKGMNIIIKYLMQISIGVALLAITIGGVMYIISPADKGMVEMGKKAMTNAFIGFALIFAGYLIINTTIQYIGTRPGMGVKSANSTFLWSNFDCSAPAGK